MHNFLIQGLYEELLLAPFDTDLKHDSFMKYYRAKRSARYQLLQDVPLSASEIGILLSILEDFPIDSFPNFEGFVSDLVARVKAIVWSEETKVTFADCLSPLYSDIAAYTPEKDDPEDLTEREDLIEAFLELLGVFAVLLEERFTRGTVMEFISFVSSY